MRVLCKGGPYYWVVDPETPFEMRLRHWKEGLLPKRGKERFTRAEYNRARREYSDKYWLPPGYVYPMSPEEEAAAWRRVELKGPITFYGASPHRPNPSAQTATTTASSHLRK